MPLEATAERGLADEQDECLGAATAAEGARAPPAVAPQSALMIALAWALLLAGLVALPVLVVLTAVGAT